MKAIDFGSLVGSQLAALIEAEAEGSEKSAEFIESVGFEKKPDGSMALRLVSFDMKRRDVDGKTRTHRISIPILTLVTIPLLTIEEAHLEFSLLIEDVVSVEENESPNSTDGGARRLLWRKPRNRLQSRLARTRRNDTTTKSDLRMTVKIAQSAFPLGIEQLLNTADLSVDDETR